MRMLNIIVSLITLTSVNAALLGDATVKNTSLGLIITQKFFDNLQFNVTEPIINAVNLYNTDKLLSASCGEARESVIMTLLFSLKRA